MSKPRTFDASIVRELFDYEDGKLIWKTRDARWFATERSCSIWNTRYPGTVAGSISTNGYRVIRLTILGFDSTFKASHLVWVWHHGKWPAACIDHIDHDRLNDRVENLREATVAENCKNRSRNRAKPDRAFGVRKVKKDEWWRAFINVQGKVVALGSFDTEAEAIAARRTAEVLFGYHENHGRDPNAPPLPREWKVVAERQTQ